MKTASNLQFFREKIYQIRSALMYSMSEGLIRMPNNIVTILRMDEEGQLWFLCKPPLQPIEQCEQSFPVRLVFYRKGIPFFMEVSGKATIVKAESDWLLSDARSSIDQPVLIRMNVTNLEISQPEEKRKKNKLDDFVDHSYKWLLNTVAFARTQKPVLQRLVHHQ